MADILPFLSGFISSGVAGTNNLARFATQQAAINDQRRKQELDAALRQNEISSLLDLVSGGNLDDPSVRTEAVKRAATMFGDIDKGASLVEEMANRRKKAEAMRVIEQNFPQLAPFFQAGIDPSEAGVGPEAEADIASTRAQEAQRLAAAEASQARAARSTEQIQTEKARQRKLDAEARKALRAPSGKAKADKLGVLIDEYTEAIKSISSGRNAVQFKQRINDMIDRRQELLDEREKELGLRRDDTQRIDRGPERPTGDKMDDDGHVNELLLRGFQGAGR